jgi:adenylate cyclase
MDSRGPPVVPLSRANPRWGLAVAKDVQRRLAAILAADVVSYSRLMEADEAGTLGALKALRRELIDARMATYRGRVVKLMGDGMLAEFPSVVDALACAIDVQEAVARRNVGVPDDRRITFRVGINLGDVMVEEDDLYGDGVNVAARLEQLAEPGGIAISGTVHEHVEGKLDARFADAGEQRIKNIARPVHVFRWSPVAEAAAALAAVSGAPELMVQKRPSIAVLPFDNLSGDPGQAYLADGIAEDVISLLSRVRWLLVIARNSTFTYKGRAVDVQEVAEELGVRYVLEGSVRSAGKRIRVSAQLIEASSRSHLWAQRYDRELEDLFALQDEITEAIVGALEPALGAAERERARQKPPHNLDAWSCYQRGLWQVYRYQRADVLEALRLFDRAIDLDPNFGSAYAGKSFCHFINVFLDYTADREFELDRAHRAAMRSVALDERDPLAHWTLGRALLVMREHDEAIAEFETAIDLSPSFAQAHFGLGWALAYSHRPEEALSEIDKAYRLSPRDPLLFGIATSRAIALMILERYAEAVQWARIALRQPNSHFRVHAVLAAALGHIGRIDEAKHVVDELLRLRPDYSRVLVERTMPFKRREDLDHFIEGLRKAGLPA